MLFFMQAARPQRVRETYELLRRRVVSVYVSAEVLDELRTVLNRPEYRRKFPALTDEAVESFLREVVSLTRFVPDVPHVYSLERDPKDSKYINLAVASGAAYLVTRDKDLLDLMDQASSDGDQFRLRFPNLRIVDPREFVVVATSPPA
jgi:putative PIN family toxin of toxin-antitoxin system